MKSSLPMGRRGCRPPVGLSLGLLVLVVLCLLLFALLSLSTADNSWRDSQRYAAAATAYAQAAAAAEARVAQTDAQLQACYAHAGRAREAYFRAARKALGIKGTALTFALPIQQGQRLQVALDLRWPPDNDGRAYAITCWQTVSDVPSATGGPQLMKP